MPFIGGMHVCHIESQAYMCDPHIYTHLNHGEQFAVQYVYVSNYRHPVLAQRTKIYFLSVVGHWKRIKILLYDICMYPGGLGAFYMSR